MFSWKLISFTCILLTIVSESQCKNKQERKSTGNTNEKENDEWHDPCESVWWNKLYGKENPLYQEFENFLDCLRDYDGIIASPLDVPSLGFGKNVPRGWWTRYRAHKQDKSYPRSLDSYEDFEKHAEYLREKYIVLINRDNFGAFWNETDIPDEWWERYESAPKSQVNNPNGDKSTKFVL